MKNVLIRNTSPSNIHRSGRDRMYWNSTRDGTLNIGRNKMKRLNFYGVRK